MGILSKGIPVPVVPVSGGCSIGNEAHNDQSHDIGVSHDRTPHAQGLTRMRQLIPRLLRRLKARSPASEKIRPIRPAKGPKSLRKQLPPPPVFFGRSQSIILDDVNPIMHPKAYRRHKSLPPQVTLPDSQKVTRIVSRDGTVEDDVRREMTPEEREWWANPYRMSPSPSPFCRVAR